MVKSFRLRFFYEARQRLGWLTQTDVVVVRFGGEIGIKGDWTRNHFERILLRNIKNALKYHSATYADIVSRRGRIYVETPKTDETACELTKVMGISSVSPAVKSTSNIDEITYASLKLAEMSLRDRSSFAVRCNRVGTHTYSSMDVCREVGRRILATLGNKNLKVNLTEPESTIGIEIREDEAYVYTKTIQGSGGFPVGSQAKVVGLLSGGIDSPVACWLAMKRGCPVTPLYMDNTPLTDERTSNKALDTAKRLFEWSIGSPRKIHIVPNGKNLQIFMEKAPRKLTCILCKRMMYRVAEHIAEMENAEGIVTGEAIGEQASQTITNLRVLDEATANYPIHRPLLGFNKTETENLARKIGTFEISTRKAKKCCAAPYQPATKAKLEIVKKAESRLPIDKMTHESIDAAKTIRL